MRWKRPEDLTPEQRLDNLSGSSTDVIRSSGYVISLQVQLDQKISRGEEITGQRKLRDVDGAPDNLKNHRQPTFGSWTSVRWIENKTCVDAQKQA